MSNAKIFVIYHVPGTLVKSEVYAPIAVGNNVNRFDKNAFLRDNVGENISSLNKTYNELTAIYWVFKHLNEFKDIQYIGFSHYRRLFCFYRNDKKSYVKREVDFARVDTNEKELDEIFKHYDFVAPCPMRYKSVKKHYDRSHNKVDVDVLIDTIKNGFPDYYDDAVSYFKGCEEYL